MNILVTSQEFIDRPGKHQDLLRIAGHLTVPVKKDQFESGKGMFDKIKVIDAAIVDDTVIPSEFIDGAVRLRVISRIGTDVSNINVARATEKNIVITYTPDLSFISKAEMTVALMFSLARHVPAYAGMISGANVAAIRNVEIWGKTLGLMGLDMTAKTVARRALGLGMRVVAYDEIRDKDFADRVGVRFCSYDELLQVSDFISFHSSPERPVGKTITANAITKMKRSVFLVNISQSELISENDLLKSLKDNWIAGYATTCPGKILASGTDPLIRSEKMIIADPSCANSDDIFLREAKMSVENVLRYFAGETTHGQANKVSRQP